MEKDWQLVVREMKPLDIYPLANYWLNASEAYLKQMGADIKKLPTKYILHEYLRNQIETPVAKKESYALIWELNGNAIGHSNVNRIIFGKEATMHLHLWNDDTRRKGMGTSFVKQSLPYYFENLQLQTLICEPYVLNPAPNKTLERVGFTFIKRYRTIPGTLNFQQEVNRWEMTKKAYENRYV